MKSFLAFLLIISLFVNVVLIGGRLLTEPTRQGQGNVSGQGVDIIELRKIATKHGVEESKVDSMSANELLTEIKIKFNATEGFYGKFLSESDLKKTENLLYGEDEIIKIIKEHEAFLQKLQGKEILILR